MRKKVFTSGQIGYFHDFVKTRIAAGDELATSAHKVSGLGEAIEIAVASLLHLPPSPSDFNLIEITFSKLKTLL